MLRSINEKEDSGWMMGVTENLTHTKLRSGLVAYNITYRITIWIKNGDNMRYLKHKERSVNEVQVLVTSGFSEGVSEVT